MIDKEILFEYGDNNSEVLQLVHPSNFTKTAEYSQVLVDFIKTIKEKADKIYALVNALSAGEFYGSNRNGDYFPEEALKEYHKTFEALGHVYRHHVNKDPEKSMGKVVFSHYNPEMHRVELIIELDKVKAEDIVTRLDKGDLPAVSMGCRVPWDECLSPDTPVVSQDKNGTLNDISIGDYVLTHTGEYKQVIAKNERIISNYIELKPFGDYLTLRGSKQHPFQIAKKEQFLEGSIVRKKSLKTSEPILDWINMENLRVGDYLVFKKTKKDKNILNLEQARILGYYVSEGFLIKERDNKGEYVDMGVSFSFNLNEKDTFVKDLCNSLDICNYKYKIYDFIEKNECRVSSYSKELAGLMKKFGGEYSNTKKLHPSIFSHDEKTLLNFLGSAINGDGSQDHNAHQGMIRYTTISQQLARDIRRVSLEVGIVASINKHLFKNEWGSNVIYNVHIPGSQTKKLSKYSEKIIEYDINKSSRFFDFKDIILIPIQELKEVNKMLVVQNLQIDKDESYQAAEYVTHNCSICGNRARTRKEYCDHLVNKMNHILPGGQRVVAINRMPKFFDISVVLIPADRTAGFLSKVAGYNGKDITFMKSARLAPSLELGLNKFAEQDTYAEIRKNIEAKVDCVSSDPKLLIRNSQARIPEEKLKKLAEFPLNQVLSTMNALRIFPLKEDFQKLALYNLGEISLADELELKGEVFNISADTVPEVPVDVNFENYNEKVAELLMEDIPDMAMTKELIVTRALTKLAEDEGTYFDPLEQLEAVKETVMPKYPEQPPAERSFISKIFFGHEPEPETTAHKNPIVPLGILGGLYYGYAKVFNNPSTTGFRQFMLKNKWLLPVLVGAGTVGSLFAQDEAFKKTAGVGVDRFFRNSLVSIPVSYYISGVQENKAKQGEPITETENFIRKHPVLTGLVASLGLVKAEKLLDKSLEISKLGQFVAKMDNAHLQLIYTDLIN